MNRGNAEGQGDGQGGPGDCGPRVPVHGHGLEGGDAVGVPVLVVVGADSVGRPRGHGQVSGVAREVAPRAVPGHLNGVDVRGGDASVEPGGAQGQAP